MIRFVLISSLILLYLQSVHSLRCAPCRNPDSCPSTGSCPYGTHLDVCNCCNVCAKGPNEVCGGAWNMAGQCGAGFTCVLPPSAIPRFDTGVCVRRNRYKRTIGDGLRRSIGRRQAMKAVHSHNAYGGITPSLKARIAAYMKSLGKV